MGSSSAAVKTEPAKNVGHRFQPGNQHAKGNPGPSKKHALTQALISQLNEIDPRTDKAKLHKIVENLIKMATGFVIVEHVLGPDGKRTGKKIEREIAPDLAAIRYIFDRVDGPLSVGFGSSNDNDEGSCGKVYLVFEKADERV